MQLAQQIAPDLEIHGSTQMSVTSADGVRLAQSFGVSRVTLARELSLAEIRAIRARDRLRTGDLRPRRAVRGVLRPVLLVGSLGRPQRQSRPVRAGLPPAVRDDGGWRPACRWATRATCSRPAISTRSEQVPEIVDIGISALKIEGRYKDADYVALTTAAYRQAVDEAWAGRTLADHRAEELRLEQVYSRGLGPFFLTGHESSGGGGRARAAPSRRADGARGARCSAIAVVLSPSVGATRCRRSSRATAWCSMPPTGAVREEPEEGGRVYAFRASRRQSDLRFGNGASILPSHSAGRPGLAHARSRYR